MKPEKSMLSIRVSGMTCHSCEERVEKALLAIPGMLAAHADQSRGMVDARWNPQVLLPGEALRSMEKALKDEGYLLKGVAEKAGNSSWASILAIAALMISGFLLVNSLGWFNFLPKIDSTLGFGMVFIAGLLTSVHCVAMCGGIAISQQAPRVGQATHTALPLATMPAGHPGPVGEQAAWETFAPDLESTAGQSTGQSRIQASLRGLQYHAGRIVSYTILGAIVGAAGSVISFSPLTKGILAGIAGLFMVGIGLRMLGLLPKFLKLGNLGLSRLVPAGFTSGLRKRGPFVVGLLNGLMPCGPLQTMQLYALGTGSAVTGALSMFLFSLGTVPLMFLFGAVSNFFSLLWQHRLVRASAVLVVFFGLLMAGRALDLSGASGMVQTMAGRMFGTFAGDRLTSGALNPETRDLQALSASGSTVESSASGGPETIASIKDGIQYVSFDLQPDSYAPITVQKGIPVRWTIQATDETLNGCNEELEVPQLGIRKKLASGANVIEFTPDSSGVISYTCWMGMISSSITVVDKLADKRPDLTIPAPRESTPGTLISPSGGCCGN